MADSEKTVFISYRRKLSVFVARAIFGDLKSHGYDVFMDVESIDSGNFESIILNQIAARTHFLVVLTPGSLEQTTNSGDWLRVEFEHAITLGRNIVPVMAQDFRFDDEAKKFPQGRFPGEVEKLRKFNGVYVHGDYIDEGMCKLRERFLRKPKTVEITPAPPSELVDVKRRIGKATNLIPGKSILNTFGLVPSAFSNIPWFTLQAPTLHLRRHVPYNFHWTPVVGAKNYVLVGSRDPFFLGSSELYKGDKREWEMVLRQGRYFRVRAENSELNLESPWSNVVTTEMEPSEVALMASLERKVLSLAPKLEIDYPARLTITDFAATPKIKWTPVLGANGYELQTSSNKWFTEPLDVYKGDRTEYACPPGPPPSLPVYYRVRAIGLLFDWSNVVEYSFLKSVLFLGGHSLTSTSPPAPTGGSNGFFCDRGWSSYQRGEYAKAISDYSAEIRDDPNHAIAYYNRGLAYKKLGKIAKAQADFDEAKRLGYTGPQ